jgi:selenocysteine lyase/cysteine desulfurase
LPGGAPFQTGGGTTRLVSPGWVIWAGAPEKFEAGTPAIVNIIAFAKALKLIRHFGKDAFRNPTAEKRSAVEILYHDELEKYSGQKLLDELSQSWSRSTTPRQVTSTKDGTLGLPQNNVQQQMNDFAKAVAQRVYS